MQPPLLQHLLRSFARFESNRATAVCSETFTEGTRHLPCLSQSNPQFLSLVPSLRRLGLSESLSFFEAKSIAEVSAHSKPLSSLVLKRYFSVGWRKSRLGLFLRRTEAVQKVCEVLGASKWNEGTPVALSSLNVRICVYVASEVLRFSVELDTAVSFFNWLKSKDGFNPDSYVYTALILRLGKAERFDEMEALAAECESRGKATCATFTCIIASYKRARNIEKAARTWGHMEELGIRPTTMTYTTMIDLLATMKMYSVAAELYLEMVQAKIFPNIKTCTVMIKHLLEVGKLEAAVTIFREMVGIKLKPNPYTYAVVMIGYAKAGDLDSVLQLVRDFKDRGHRSYPVGNPFWPVLKFLLGEGRLFDVERVVIEIWPEFSADERQKKFVELRKALATDALYRAGRGSVNSIENTESDSNSTDDEDDTSRDLLSMVGPRSVWNIAAFVRCLDPWTAVTVECLEHAKVHWDEYFVSATLKRLRRPSVAWKFFEWVRGQPDFSHDSITYSRMIQMFLGAGDFKHVRRLLEEVQKEGLRLPLHLYNKILKYCGMNREADIALDVFDLLHKAGLKPDESTYKLLIIVLDKCERYWRAATILTKMQRAGMHPSAEIYGLVMNGFGQAGDLKMVNALYKRMHASCIKPNEHVFGAFISAFCKMDDLASIKKIYAVMKHAGITPSRKTYNIMIETFGRSGKHDVAQKLEDDRKEASVNRVSRGKAHYMKAVSIHKVFVESLTESNMPQSALVG